MEGRQKQNFCGCLNRNQISVIVHFEILYDQLLISRCSASRISTYLFISSENIERTLFKGKKEVGAYAMKHVALGADLPIPIGF